MTQTNKPKTKNMQKTGLEIMALYKDVKAAGLKPEEAMLYLLAHMEQLKAQIIGMDLTAPNGKRMSMTVTIHPFGEDPEAVVLPPTKQNKFSNPAVR